jgi:hypothetical protein
MGRITMTTGLVALLMCWMGVAPTHGGGNPPWKLSDLKLNQDGTGSATLKTDGKASGGPTLRIQLKDANGKQLLQVDLDPVIDDEDLKSSREAWLMTKSQIEFKSKKIADSMAGNPKPAKATARILIPGGRALTDAVEIKISSK